MQQRQTRRQKGNGMKPNIDRGGRLARAVSGLVCVVAGILLWSLGWPEAMGYRWVLTVMLVAAGLFQLFEAKTAWCVARACGLRTPL